MGEPVLKHSGSSLEANSVAFTDFAVNNNGDGTFLYQITAVISDGFQNLDGFEIGFNEPALLNATQSTNYVNGFQLPSPVDIEITYADGHVAHTDGSLNRELIYAYENGLPRGYVPSNTTFQDNILRIDSGGIQASDNYRGGHVGTNFLTTTEQYTSGQAFVDTFIDSTNITPFWCITC